MAVCQERIPLTAWPFCIIIEQMIDLKLARGEIEDLAGGARGAKPPRDLKNICMRQNRRFSRMPAESEQGGTHCETPPGELEGVRKHPS